MRLSTAYGGAECETDAAHLPETPGQADADDVLVRLWLKEPDRADALDRRLAHPVPLVTAVWRKLGEFTMGRLLSRIAASHSTGSNRRTSHGYPYFIQLRALMCFFRSVSPHPLQTAASAYPQHGRCASGLRT